MFRSQKKRVTKVVEKKEEDPEKLATLKYLGDLEEMEERMQAQNK